MLAGSLDAQTEGRVGHAVKVSSDLVMAAEQEARVWSRSMAGQIEHWARLGRAIEAQPDVDLGRIRAALTGTLAFDALNVNERPMALAALEGEVLAADGDRGFQKELLAKGRSYSAVVAGRVVVVAPAASRKETPEVRGKGRSPPPMASPAAMAGAAKGTRKVATKTRTAKKR